MARIERSVHILILDNHYSPPDFSDSHKYIRWQRIWYPGSRTASWFPEDENGEVFPYNAFKLTLEAGGDSFLEKKYRECVQDS